MNNSTIQTDNVTTLFDSTPNQCPRFDNCSAPICAADNEWRLTRHTKDDPVCFYLREVVKMERLQEPISVGSSDPMLVAAAQLWEQRKYFAAPLLNQLQRASTSGSKRAPVKPTVDPARAQRAMKKLTKIFGEADLPISRFV